jgi:predicted P-loop ATPase
MDALLKLRYAMRINAITGYTEIAERKEAETEQVYHVVTGYDTSSIAQDIQCEDINMWKVDVSNYLESNKVAMYHPFLQYFELLPKWDGKDRVTKLAERVSSSATWVNGFHRWMLAVTAQWMGYALKQKGVAMTRANSVAPIIISQQQGWGKSTFCRMLMPEELQEYYTDSFDIKQSAACEAKLMEYGLINLDEFDQISSRRNAQLKNLM